MATTGGNSTGYTSGRPAGSVGRAPASDDPRQQEDKDGFWPLDKCVRAYNTYLDSKQLEIEEQQTARRYRHGAQWTSDQIKTFNDRKQPVVTYNKIGTQDRRRGGRDRSAQARPEGISPHARSIRPAPTSRPRCCDICATATNGTRFRRRSPSRPRWMVWPASNWTSRPCRHKRPPRPACRHSKNRTTMC